jgi:hemerythrin-like domain-containing protein
MTNRVARWLEDHANFARLLDILEGELEAFHWAAKPDYRLMLDIMSYMTQYPDRFHHPPEELAFAKAAKKNPRIRATVELLKREHVALRVSGEALVRNLEAILNEAILPRIDVESSGREYIRDLRRHMRREEGEAFPVVARGLRAADWAEIDFAIEHRPDPLFGHAAEERFSMLRRQIAAESHAAAD